MATTPLVTGAAWTYDKARRRWWAEFDRNAIRDIPVGWADFFADLGSAYASHTLIIASPLVCTGSAESGGVIKFRLSEDGSGTLNQLYPFTVRAVAVDGERDDQTLWLKLVEY